MPADARKTVLIAEDASLISMMIEDELEETGFAITGPFPSCAAAMDWLQGNTPDAAVLDLSLADGECRDLARELSGRGVPFIVYSGHDPADAPPEFAEAQWITKPAPASVVGEALVAAIRDRSTA
jgi:DNA-binding response OmpR family regulator